jgi:ABC-2 type transport system permease protein
VEQDTSPDTGSEIKIIKSSSSSVKSQIVYQIVKSYSQTFNNISAIYTALQENGENIRDNKMLGGEIAAWGIGVSTTNYTNIVEVSREKTLSSKQIFATSMFSLMSLFVCITGTLGMIKERDSKTLDRLKSTSVSYEKLFYGKLLFIFTTSFLSGLLYILINSIIGIGWGDNPLRLIMMVILHSFALTGITAVFMNIFKKQQTATGVLASGLGIMGSLGGTFFPVEYSSAVMKKIANGTINYWIQNSYGKIITGRSFNELAVNIIVLLSIGILGMLIGTAAARKSSRL